ncbi:5-formyltetrahydrofolate cyclo-ligase [Desulfuromonas sp. AOP6]|uniref:5-formyltetrahydrofolate cyclo-ligase n=1 Tax=Desulfuromonas sp. AOP6 TaxID=1566351 RepID=UPI00127D1CD4|nr:5-formyltetrahydrofolate cyclo-ligase [Desulfuromonas sp. AOP6]BCA79171.1 5-formyltetrahydrofolate cyclo-ligase [Desulfuromonas sp. AOP6]
MPKHSIRERMLAERRHLAPATCFSRSLLAQRRLLQTPEFQSARTVGLYSPIMNEVFTETLFEVARDQGKQILYPRVGKDLLEFVVVEDRKELVHGRFGVLEPIGQVVLVAADIDFLVIPGLAFDLSGFRLGYGKGCYDRALAQRAGRGVLAGLCFDFQVLAQLPTELHDIRLDLVLTESRTINNIR